jgi:hypothetical protein
LSAGQQREARFRLDSIWGFELVPTLKGAEVALERVLVDSQGPLLATGMLPVQALQKVLALLA